MRVEAKIIRGKYKENRDTGEMEERGKGISDFGFRIADCGLRIAISKLAD